MVLMAIDHASLAFNGGRLGDDSWYAHEAGSALPAAQFFTRWITHLCAPTFVFLAGTALALSFERRRLVGARDRDLDRHLFKRALVILAFELLWWSPFALQVLFAIAMGLICMIPLRRLSTRTLLITALAILFLYEAVFWGIMHLGDVTADLIREVNHMPVPDGEFDQEAMNEAAAQVRNLGWMSVFTPLFHPGLAVKIGPIPLWVQYPFVPWLGMMMLGWLLGRYLVQQTVAVTPVEVPAGADGSTVAAPAAVPAGAAVGEPISAARSATSVERLLVISGLAALGLFVLFRAWNGYGNMLLFREDFSPVQWLHVNKYPPKPDFRLAGVGPDGPYPVRFLPVPADDERSGPKPESPARVRPDCLLLLPDSHAHPDLQRTGPGYVHATGTGHRLPGRPGGADPALSGVPVVPPLQSPPAPRLGEVYLVRASKPLRYTLHVQFRFSPAEVRAGSSRWNPEHAVDGFLDFRKRVIS